MQRGQINPGHAVGKPRGYVLGDGQGQACLAYPTGTGQRQQRDGLVQDERTSGGTVGFPADEPGARERNHARKRSRMRCIHGPQR